MFLLFAVLTTSATLLSFGIGYGLAVLLGVPSQAMAYGLSGAIPCFVTATVGSAIGYALASR